MNREPIRLGISACLLGERVRFDGGHKRDPFLVETLGPFVEWVPVCPEVESGMAAPRESLRLVQTGIEIRLITNKTAQDQTASMRGYARRRLEELAQSELCGFVLKKDSPTCGLERVKVYGTGGMPAEIRTRAVCGRPGDTLSDAAGRRGRAAQQSPPARELHRAGVCVSTSRASVRQRRWSMGDVVRFHTIHKLTLMAHRPESYQRLGRLVASGKSMDRQEINTATGENGAMLKPSACNMTKRWIEKNDPNPAQTFSCVANVGTGGNSDEMPLGGMRDAFEDRMADNTNTGFRRTDALLGVVFLTDEEDCSYEQPVNLSFTQSLCDAQMEPAANYVAFLDTYTGHRSRWAAAAIAGMGPGAAARRSAMRPRRRGSRRSCSRRGRMRGCRRSATAICR